jgi:hypothetical protein
VAVRLARQKGAKDEQVQCAADLDDKVKFNSVILLARLPPASPSSTSHAMSWRFGSSSEEFAPSPR